MPSDSDPLIAAALEPMPEGELKLAACSALASLSHGRDGEDQVTDQLAFDRWKSRDKMPGWSYRRLILWISAFLIVLASIPFHYKDAIRYHKMDGLSPFGWEELRDDVEDYFGAASWSKEQRLLLFGDPSLREADKMRTLWEMHPEDPAYFSDHVSCYLGEEGALPADFRETAARIDPENAYFIYLEASLMARDAASLRPLSRRDPKDEGLQYDLLDSGKLDRTLELAATAVTKSRQSSYRDVLYLRRGNLLKADTRLDIVHRSLLIYGKSGPSAVRSLAYAYNLRAQELVKAGDRQAFLDLWKSAEAYLNHLARSDDVSLLELMIHQGNTSLISEAFADAAEKLGLADEAVRILGIDRRIQRVESQRNLRRNEASRFDGRGDASLGIFLPVFEKLSPVPPSISMEDVMMGGKADHALVWRGLAICVGLLAGLMAILAGSIQYLIPRLLRLLGDRFGQLLTVRDHAWILGAGLFFPTCFVFGLSYLSAFGGREWSVERTMPLLPTVHAAVWLLLTFGISILATRHRLMLRSGRFGLGSSTWISRMGIFAMILAALAIPITGIYVGLGTPSYPEAWILAVFLVPALVWLVALMPAAFFGTIQVRLTAVVVSKMLPVVFVSMTVLAMVLAVVFRWEDDHRFSQYQLIRSTNGQANSIIEIEVRNAMRAEMLEVLSPEL